MNPFFSVIIPTYNQCDLLKKAIHSVEKQTFTNYELIVIDNSSSDGTGEFLGEKKNLIYKKINNNGIIAKSRNLGIELAKGQWLSFLDSDDIWFEDKLAKTFDKIKKGNFDVICNDEWIINSFNTEKKIWSYGPYEKNFYKKLILFGNRNSTSATSVKKIFLSNNNVKFNEKSEFVTAEDYEFFLKIALKNGVFNYINIPLGAHLFHDKSESAKLNRSFEVQKNVIKYHVYNHQKFSKKDALWKKIKILYEIKSTFLSFKKHVKITKIFNIFCLILNIPIISFFLFVFLIKKLIRQYKLQKKYNFIL